MKICSRCDIEQEDNQFATHRGQCRLCRNFLQRARNKKYSKTKKGKLSKQRWYAKEREKGWDVFYLKYHGRARTLEERYGMSVEEYNRILAEQKGLCAICGEPETRKKVSSSGAVRIMQLSVDHNHETGKVRALLCQKCNAGIAQFGENIKYLANAISYLQKHKEEGSLAEVVTGA